MNPTATAQQINQDNQVLFDKRVPPEQLTFEFKKAINNKPILDAILYATAQQTGARSVSSLKNPETALKKVKTKNEEDPKRHYTISDVNDFARGRLIYPDEKSMRQAIGVFKENAKANGVKIGKTQDYFTKPAEGYKGYHIDLEFPNGQTSEVQFHTDHSYAFTMATHPAHSQYGDEQPANVEQKNEQISKHIEGLPNDLARAIGAVKELQVAPQTAVGQAKAYQVANSGFQTSPAVTALLGLRGKYGL